MGFKTMEQYTDDKYHGRLVLKNDGDSATVIFLYRSAADILIANAHYIKGSDYSGYVHCTGHGCPACAKGIRTQSKLFVPVYNVDTDEILFFERDTKYFMEQIKSLMVSYPNLSEFVFRITRRGAAGSRDTRYDITALAKNSALPYDKILSDKGVKMPDYYETIIRDMSSGELAMAIATTGGYSTSASASDLPDFTPQPRVTVTPTDAPTAAAEALDDIDSFEDLGEGETEF